MRADTLTNWLLEMSLAARNERLRQAARDAGLTRVRLLSLPDAARGCGRSPATLRRWVACGLLTNHGTARRIMLDWRQVADVNATRRHSPHAGA